MVAKKDNEAHSKPVFKRTRGLSKFYANKAQSFSSLDHALSTCLGHSALALEKPRPRSYDASPKSDVDVEVIDSHLPHISLLSSLFAQFALLALPCVLTCSQILVLTCARFL